MAPRAPRPSAPLPVARTVQAAGQSMRGTETASRPSGPSKTSVLIPPWLDVVARVPVVVTLTRQRRTHRLLKLEAIEQRQAVAHLIAKLGLAPAGEISLIQLTRVGDASLVFPH